MQRIGGGDNVLHLRNRRGLPGHQPRGQVEADTTIYRSSQPCPAEVTRETAMNPLVQQCFNDLEKKRWGAADTLRSHLDAAVDKHVVLGLIFLKYVSDAFEELKKVFNKTGSMPFSIEIDC
jgi:type I restriction enzyme M protein